MCLKIAIVLPDWNRPKILRGHHRLDATIDDMLVDVNHRTGLLTKNHLPGSADFILFLEDSI